MPVLSRKARPGDSRPLYMGGMMLRPVVSGGTTTVECPDRIARLMRLDGWKDSATAPAPELEPEAVATFEPSAYSASAIKAWVRGKDAEDRAEVGAALVAEQAGRNRVSVVRALEAWLDA